SAFLALVGLMLSLFIRRRRVWVRATSEESGVTVVSVAGLMRSDEGDVSADVGGVADALAGRTPA
ncbi:MAG: cytochrome c biogenesis protein ResB, partial [Actinomycetales bacterium]|nr:cytochrome c biogenesis protein ResB [Actinomycetales bacterium]